MKVTLIVVVLAGLVLATTLAFKYAGDVKQLRQDLTSQSDSTAAVRSRLAVADDSLGSMIEQLGVLATERDSISQLHAEATQLAGRMSSRAARFSRAVDSLEALYEEQQARYDEEVQRLSVVQAQLADTSTVLVQIRGQLDSANVVLGQRSVLINQIQPWYAKWKHDATQRNWLEKLFGSDKAPTPDFPEPVMPDMTGGQDTSQASADLQAKQ